MLVSRANGMDADLTVSGADIDLLKCDPGDLDPHSVAGLFKSYLRERKYGVASREFH
jgi:hypothetical protein